MFRDKKAPALKRNTAQHGTIANTLSTLRDDYSAQLANSTIQPIIQEFLSSIPVDYFTPKKKDEDIYSLLSGLYYCLSALDKLGFQQNDAHYKTASAHLIAIASAFLTIMATHAQQLSQVTRWQAASCTLMLNLLQAQAHYLHIIKKHKFDLQLLTESLLLTTQNISNRLTPQLKRISTGNFFTINQICEHITTATDTLTTTQDVELFQPILTHLSHAFTASIAKFTWQELTSLQQLHEQFIANITLYTPTAQNHEIESKEQVELQTAVKPTLCDFYSGLTASINIRISVLCQHQWKNLLANEQQQIMAQLWQNIENLQHSLTQLIVTTPLQQLTNLDTVAASLQTALLVVVEKNDNRQSLFKKLQEYYDNMLQLLTTSEQDAKHADETAVTPATQYLLAYYNRCAGLIESNLHKRFSTNSTAAASSAQALANSSSLFASPEVILPAIPDRIQQYRQATSNCEQYNSHGM